MRRHLLLTLTTTAALALAGCGSSGGDQVVDPPASEDAATGGALTFTGTDDIAWAETTKSVAAGEIELTLVCGEAANHALTLDGDATSDPILACDAGETVTGTTTLEPGTYTYVCTVPGHEQIGMVGELTVG